MFGNKEQLKEEVNKSDYLRFKDDEPQKLVFLGSLRSGVYKFENGQYVKCTANEEGANKRYVSNVWTEDGVKVATITPKTVKQLLQLDDDLNGDGANYWVAIKRSKARYDVRAVRPVTAEERTKIDEAEQFNLDDKFSWLDADAEDNIPF